jgi:hypothetical protein
MRSRWSKIGTIVVSLAVTITAFAAPKTQTYTGQISDAMCGAKHQMGSPAECTRACVKQGSKYALVVGDKVYTLQTDDKTTLAGLDKLAGEKAAVKGKLEGDTINVSSVAPAP